MQVDVSSREVTVEIECLGRPAWSITTAYSNLDLCRLSASDHSWALDLDDLCCESVGWMTGG